METHVWYMRTRVTHKKAHNTRETDALFIWCVCTYTRAQQSCSARLLEWLGLPDLHSSRYVYRQRGDEISLAIARSLSVPYPVFFSVPALFIAYWTHTHTHGWVEEMTWWFLGLNVLPLQMKLALSGYSYMYLMIQVRALSLYILSFLWCSPNHLVLFKYVNKIFTSWKILQD